MGCRDRKDCVIEIGDLVLVVYPFMEWEWQRYKIGDLGIVLKISHYSSYSVVRAKLFRTGKVEPIPTDYVIKLGDDNECGRSGSFD